MDRTGFIAYLEGKNLAERTIIYYMKGVGSFFKYLKKEDIQVTKPDVLKYLERLKNKGLQNVTRRNHLIALNHYFTFLYKDEQISVNPCLLLKIRGTNKKTLYKIYTPEELDELFDAYYQLFVRTYDDSRHRHERQKQYAALGRERNIVILSILLNQGITTAELGRIELDDIDLIKATLKIRGGKRLKDRTLPLKASQIGLLMQYKQNIRPQLEEYQTKESEKLFLPLPAIGKKKTDNDTLDSIFFTLTPAIKTIDKQFFNFLQIRASVITFWIKTQGLRKAQYMAGHSNINTTEKYVSNDLEDLTNDINQLHPF
jgi:site-specific recombinase XerD